MQITQWYRIRPQQYLVSSTHWTLLTTDFALYQMAFVVRSMPSQPMHRTKAGPE
jgi:hypothetical protein